MQTESHNTKRTRYAIYARYSSDMQNELSIEEQLRCCREAIAKRGGVVVQEYSDSAQSGWSLDRDGFQKMRADASRGKFDAIMFWKFDRLARDNNHVVMIKAMLRNECGIKLHCVVGASSDDSNDPMDAFVEDMLAVFSAFYSRNLSIDTKRSKKHRAMTGEYNGSSDPFGYKLITADEATPDKPAGLCIIPREAALVRRAFKRYATANFSDRDIAQWLNQRLYVQRVRQGELPFGKEMVRDMLQNQLYVGRVSYCETLYNGTLGEGKRSARNRKEWFEGKHQGFISMELFEAVQEVRKTMAKHHKAAPKMHTYVLQDHIYCARCTARKPSNLADERYGKMRPHWDNRANVGQYICLCRDRGYEDCGQKYVRAERIDQQVAEKLSNLQIPAGYRERVEQEVQNRVENQAALEHMRELEEQIKRIDFSWEQGFLQPEQYIEKRTQLQKLIESFRPIDYDSLIEAADLLENFGKYWAECESVENPEEARQQLIAKLVDRVFVYDDNVIAIALHGEFSVVLATDNQVPSEVLEQLSKALESAQPDDLSGCTRNGSDGLGYRTCYLWTAFRIDYHLVVDYWLERLSQRRNQTQNPQSNIPRNSIPTSNSAQAGKVA